ncbi:hypothetical protein ACJMK2_002948, partial [Sinanodonta woodiana]
MAAASPQVCCICKDSFKSPKLIPCNHSFCYKCLDDYVRVNLRNGRFNCPLCRTSVTLPKEGVSGFESSVYSKDCDSLKTFEQKNTKEIIASEKYECEKYACDICGPNSIACFRCLDCEENFCQVCSNVHEKLKATRHHKISDLGTLDQKTKGTIRQRIFCEMHPEEEIKLVCQKSVNHDTHSSKTVADVAVQVQKILQATITECTVELRRLKVCAQTGEEIEKRINDAEQQEIQAVECQLLQLYTLFNQEAVKLIDKIKFIYGELRKENVAFRSGVQNKVTLCFTAHENAAKLISQGTDIEKVQKGLILQQQIVEAYSKTAPSPPRLERKIFSPFAGRQSNFGSFLGNVQDSTKVDQ